MPAMARGNGSQGVPDFSETELKSLPWAMAWLGSVRIARILLQKTAQRRSQQNRRAAAALHRLSGGTTTE